MAEAEAESTSEQIGPKTKIDWEQPPSSEEERDERTRRLYQTLKISMESMHGGIYYEHMDLTLHPEHQQMHDEEADIRASSG